MQSNRPGKRRLRAVLDTNIIVAGIISPRERPPQQLLEAWANRRFILITCPSIIEEVEEVLKRPKIQQKYRVADDDIHLIITLLRNYAIVVRGTLRIDDIPDPMDQPIFASALEGSANYIVTGDKALLKMVRYEQIPIITAQTFLGLLMDA